MTLPKLIDKCGIPWLSEATGIRENYFYRWRKGRSKPNAENVARICLAANYTHETAANGVMNFFPDKER